MRELERRFGSDIAIIGVHSGKFIAERQSAHIRDASLRLGAVHPTINDWQFRVWRAYAVRAWPTLVVIDQRGYVAGMRAGEFTADAVGEFLDRILSPTRTARAFSATPIAPDPPSTTPGILSFPGSVALDGRRIAIADSGHHRVLIGTLCDTGAEMQIERIVGTGQAGYRDGIEALFANPQGMAFDGDLLHVADAGNHAIRTIELSSGVVRTLAGTGHQLRTAADAKAGALSSPWALTLLGDVLFIAMAGLHQVWQLLVSTGSVSVHCGSGAEELFDGELSRAALAQPMGICSAGSTLYFSDAESSAIRAADTSRVGSVRTIVGTGLFDFGDRDGTGDDVRLQHPSGIVATPDGRLLVADTYNGCLKWVDPVTRRVETLVRDLQEPTGLFFSDGRVYVTETNQHRVIIVTLDGTGDSSTSPHVVLHTVM